MAELFPVDVSALPSHPDGPATGAEKKKARNSLPAVFIGVSGKPLLATCAILIAHVYRIGHGGRLIAMLGGVAALAAPKALGPTAAWAYSLVYQLPPQEEMAARQAASSTGAALNNHFEEFAAARWRAWLLPAGAMDTHIGDAPAYVEMPEKYLRVWGRGNCYR